jgi:hypothetical protein
MKKLNMDKSKNTNINLPPTKFIVRERKNKKYTYKKVWEKAYKK